MRPGTSPFGYEVKDSDLKSTAASVQEFGWATMIVSDAVDEPSDEPDFIYTINLDEHCGLNDTIIFSQTHGQSFLHELVGLAEERRLPIDEELSGVLVDFPIILRPVHQSHIPTYFGYNIAFRRETGRPRLTRPFQLFWPWPGDGLFPWELEQDDERQWYQPRLDLLSTKGPDGLSLH